MSQIWLGGDRPSSDILHPILNQLLHSSTTREHQVDKMSSSMNLKRACTSSAAALVFPDTRMKSPRRQTKPCSWKMQRINVLCCSLCLLFAIIPSPGSAMMVPPRQVRFTSYTRSKTASFVAASRVNDAVTPENQVHDDDEANKTPVPFDVWLDMTTARLLNLPPPTLSPKRQRVENPHSPYTQYQTSSPGYIPLGELTVDDVQLITTLMTSHARRGTVESALTCERLLKRVVEEVNSGNSSVSVTTKMYTMTMDAWAKSQRRPLPGSINYGAENEKKSERRQTQQLQVHPELKPDNKKQQQQIPLGAAAQRAHRIHNSLVAAYKSTGDPNLAPSAVSFNAAINAWAKSYHPSSGEMAELLLGEMMKEWKFGQNNDDSENQDDSSDADDWDEEEGDGSITKRGNRRVRPDVVTFTAVIDAWVKCTSLAHDYHYEQPPPNPHFYSSNFTISKFRKEKENYVEWKRNQAAKADELTRRAATRAKQLLELMIQLSHYDPANPNKKYEACMRPNCYTYSAVMNALAKSCSALRAVSPSAIEKGVVYDPAKEAQDMLEEMIEKYERYKARVGEPETWKSLDYSKRFEVNDTMQTEVGDTSPDPDETEMSWENMSPRDFEKKMEGKLPSPNNVSPHWFDPRLDEASFPPNTINYNSVLNGWSRASRYDSQAALKAEQILLERMERPQSKGGDAVEPDALSYSLVIHAWLRGCRGFNGANAAARSSNGKNEAYIKFTDQERIKRAINIVDRMEAWARSNHQSKWNDELSEEDDESNYNDEIIDELDNGSSDDDELALISDEDVDDSKDLARSSPSFRIHNKARHLDAEVYK